jgi:hypothetical protein
VELKDGVVVISVHSVVKRIKILNTYQKKTVYFIYGFSSRLQGEMFYPSFNLAKALNIPIVSLVLSLSSAMKNSIALVPT